MAYNGHTWVNNTDPAINATHLNELDNEVVYLDKSVTSISDSFGTIGPFPDAMKNDVASYKSVTPNAYRGYRYSVATGALVEDASYSAYKFPVKWNDKIRIKGNAIALYNAYSILFMQGDTIIKMIPRDEAYSEYMTVPFGADEVRFTDTLAAYDQNKVICEKMTYDSIANKPYVESIASEHDILSAVPISYVVTDNYRINSLGEKISASGYYAIEFDVNSGDYVTFMNSNIGSSIALAIYLMKDSTVISSVSDSGISTTGKYSLTVPDGVNKIKASGILAAKYQYNVFKRIVLPDGCYTGNEYKNASQHTYIVGEGYMPTIQCAIDFADENDIIFIKSGTYNENVHCWYKKRHLIGENVNTTFIVDHIGNYKTPPLEMNIGSLSNITLIEDGSDSEHDPYPTQQNSAYCLHVEAINSSEEIFEVKNCVFKDAVHAAVGIGLQKDYTIRFRDCVFETTAVNEGSLERGSLFCHLATTNNTPTNQHLIVENSVIYSADNFAVSLGIPQAATGSGDYRFSNCCIWSKNNGIKNESVKFFISTQNATFDMVESYGNTIDLLNTVTNEQVSALLEEIARIKTIRIMSRQGEFYIPGTISNRPYNNRIAIKNASESGFDEIRISVRFTSDHYVVLSHDASINSIARNPDGTAISEEVLIADHTLAELNEYDYGIYFGPQYAGETITTLDEALLLCKKYGLFCCIEVYPAEELVSENIIALCNDIVKSGSVRISEVRSPILANLQNVANIIPGANFDITMTYANSLADMRAKITGLKALKHLMNNLAVTVVPAMIGIERFETIMTEITKEGISLEMASANNMTDLLNYINDGKYTVIETTHIYFPYAKLKEEYGGE